MSARRPEPGCAPERARASSGFTLIELIFAVVILTIGVLGLAGTTAHVVRTTTLADLRTERAAALQTAIEQLRALPFDSLGSGSDTVGVYEVSWTSTARGPMARDIRVITRGPGLSAAGYAGGLPIILRDVPDTFTYVIVRQ